jgi:hypothetical protein
VSERTGFTAGLLEMLISKGADGILGHLSLQIVVENPGLTPE